MNPTIDVPMRISVPGDKSISHRAVLYAAIANGTSRVRHLSAGNDVTSSQECLRALGIRIEQQGSNVLIHGNGMHGFREPSGPLDCGNSGTTMRLLSGILAGQSIRAELTGDRSLRQRPMRRIMDPLGSMGASFSGSEDGHAPFVIQGSTSLRGIDYTMPVASAQVKSAVLFAGLYAKGNTTVREASPTRDHTERILGADVRNDGNSRVITIAPVEHLDPIDVTIPGDPSSAAFLIVAAILLGRDNILLEGVSTNPTRTAYLSLLGSHGASISLASPGSRHGEPVADVAVHRSALAGEMQIREDIAGLIDEIPILAVAATCSGMPFSVRHAEELRHKESDRISMLVKNLRAIGCDVEEYADGFASSPKNGLIGAMIETHGDHRIAMAFGIAGLVIDGITIDDPACADVSFPGFWTLLESLRAS